MDYHVLAGSMSRGAVTYNVVFHIPVPDQTNAVNVNYRTVISTYTDTISEVPDIEASEQTDAESAYILELGTGTTDNGRAIVAELETHDLPLADAVSVYQVDLKAKYPGTASSYRVTLTDHNGDQQDFSLSPNSSEDVRGHRTGCRFKEPVSMRAKIVQRAVAQNELRSLALKFTTRE